MAGESNVSPEKADDLNDLPQLHPTGALAKYLKRHLKVETWIAYSLAHALKQLRPKAAESHPCLVVVFDKAEIQARAAAAQLTPAEALQALDGALTNYGARVETFATAQDQKVTKAYYFKTFREYQEAHEQMTVTPALRWAFTPSRNRQIEMAGGVAPPGPAPVPITCADLLFLAPDIGDSVGDCAKVDFFIKR